jgi:hypothetical protein
MLFRGSLVVLVQFGCVKRGCEVEATNVGTTDVETVPSALGPRDRLVDRYFLRHQRHHVWARE